MTKLKGKLERETGLLWEGRAVIVGLEAPGDVTVKLKGTRHVYTLPATTLYQVAVQRHVEATLGKPRTRKVGRGLLRR